MPSFEDGHRSSALIGLGQANRETVGMKQCFRKCYGPHRRRGPAGNDRIRILCQVEWNANGIPRWNSKREELALSRDFDAFWRPSAGGLSGSGLAKTKFLLNSGCKISAAVAAHAAICKGVAVHSRARAFVTARFSVREKAL